MTFDVKSVVSPEMISIHASAREATNVSVDYLMTGKVSIHASAREATGSATLKAFAFKVSIHASAREATVDIF